MGWVGLSDPCKVLKGTKNSKNTVGRFRGFVKCHRGTTLREFLDPNRAREIVGSGNDLRFNGATMRRRQGWKGGRGASM